MSNRSKLIVQKALEEFSASVQVNDLSASVQVCI